jgi:DNA-binding MarR family transcriptional regulator
MGKTAGIISLISTVRYKANRFIMEQLKGASLSNIATAYGDILVCLFKEDELSMGAIAQKIDRDKSTVTALIKKLVRMGYVQTRTGRDDSRVTLVTLTSEGLVLENDFNKISESLQERIYRGFTDLEKDILVRLLSRIKDNLKDS